MPRTSGTPTSGLKCSGHEYEKLTALYAACNVVRHATA